MALDAEPIAGPSTAPLVPGPSAYHESSQFRHWRYSPAQLDKIRGELNQKSVEVVARNQELEKEAQISLGHEFTAPPPASTYLSVTDELLLLHFYISQASKICRGGFGLPEVVESTAISYLKRFYLKNSVMEWHPKVIMPTCLFLAAKTTNYPVPIDVFVQKIAKLQPSDVLDTEFLVAQSLAFEFWVRGAEKALRGWGLEFQEQPTLNLDLLQQSLPAASAHLSASRGTDAEFLYSPSQIALACWYRASPGLVEGFLEWRYGSYRPSGDTQGIGGETRNGIDSAGQSGTSTPVPIPQEEQNEDTKMVDEQNREKIVYGMEKERLLQIVAEITALIDRVEEVEIKKVKEVDKRLKACTNPEKVVGTALYIKRKQEREASEASARAAKALKAQKEMSSRESIFGDIIQAQQPRKPLSPRVTIPSGLTVREAREGQGEGPDRGPDRGIGTAGTGEGDGFMEPSGFGVRDEAMGMVVGGRGLKDVGIELEEDD